VSLILGNGIECHKHEGSVFSHCNIGHVHPQATYVDIAFHVDGGCTLRYSPTQRKLHPISDYEE
jgi:hypothetical protein